MARSFPDTVEIHNVADARFDTSRGDQSATRVLKANGEADFILEQEATTYTGTVPALPGWGQNVAGSQKFVVFIAGPSGSVRAIPLELDAEETLLRIEPDWHDAANPPEE